jgi:hypothetical protein
MRLRTFYLFLSGVYLSTTEILNTISFAAIVKAKIRFYAPVLTKILRLTVTNSLRFCCRIYVMIGIAAAIFVSIPVCIVCCLFCSVCPAYKYRQKRGAVYGASKYTRLKLLCRLPVALQAEITNSFWWRSLYIKHTVSHDEVLIRENNAVRKQTLNR